MKPDVYCAGGVRTNTIVCSVCSVVTDAICYGGYIYDRQKAPYESIAIEVCELCVIYMLRLQSIRYKLMRDNRRRVDYNRLGRCISNVNVYTHIIYPSICDRLNWHAGTYANALRLICESTCSDIARYVVKLLCTSAWRSSRYEIINMQRKSQ